MDIKTWLRSACALATLLTANLAAADAPLAIAPVESNQIRVDGELGEWRNARFTKLGSASDASVRFSLAFEAGALYVAARVSDDAMVRSGSPSRKEDALVLTLVAPAAKSPPSVSELWLFAGVPGKHKSTAAVGPAGSALRAVAGAAIIEGPAEQGQGYVLEARIPLEAIDGGELLFLGRGALALHDVDPGSARAEMLATASGAPAKLPELLFDGGPNAALAAFVREKGLPPSDLRFERFGDVAGDERIERVLIAGSYLLMAGADRSGGFRFIDLPIAVGAALTDVALEDLTGDGKLDIVIRVREPEADAVLAYRSDTGRFVLHTQERTPNAKAKAAQAAADAERAARAKPVDEVPAAEHSIVYDKPPGMDELVAAFRETRGVPASTRARFVTHANVAEDSAIESLMLFDRELLVVGKGFRGGTGFFYFGVPAASGKDILRMFTGDVTGDGRREIFIRIRQFVGEVQREILLGYTFAGDALQPILAQEVRRAQGGDSVGNIVRLARARNGRGFALHIAPGVAHGYTRESYPFVTEATDAYGALLLPWLHEEVVYRWDGGQLAH